MKDRSYLGGFTYIFLAALIWGCVQVLYFNKINYINPLEIISHRAIWALIFLFFFVVIQKKIKNFINIFYNKKYFLYLLITAFLVSSNWYFFIFSVSINRVQDSSMGYFISPIFSVLFGYIFFKESFSKVQILSLFLIILAILNLIFNIGYIPWIALSLATTWSLYGLLRKKIKVDSEVGLFFETAALSPFFLYYLYTLEQQNIAYFEFKFSIISFYLIGGGLVTLIPLFFFNKGIKMIPLSISGLIFYLVPTLQFLTSIIILKEPISFIKIISFILIWIAVIIFINESIKNNNKI